MDIKTEDINFDDFITVPPPRNAMLRTNYEMEFETEESIKVKIALGCGEVVDYDQNEDGSFSVWRDAVMLEIPDDLFPLLFRPVDFAKLPKDKRYYSLDEISVELVKGWITWIHDFDQDLILKAAVSIEDPEMGEVEQPEYVMYMVIASMEDENGGIDKAVSYRPARYSFNEYGDTWAALRERHEEEI